MSQRRLRAVAALVFMHRNDQTLPTPGEWMLIMAARFVRFLGAALLILAASYVIFFAHIFYLRARLACDDFFERSRWIPYLWGGGWRVQHAVVLGGSGARDPQLVVGSLHAVADSANAGGAAVTFSSATRPLLVHLPALARCALLHEHCTLMAGRAPVVARFDRCDHALAFLRNLAPDVRLQATTASSAPARPLAYNTHAHAAIAPVRGVDAAAAVELRMWILPTGAPLLVAHMSWSLVDVLRILARSRRLPLTDTDANVMLPALTRPQQQQTDANKVARPQQRRTVFAALPSQDHRRALIDCVAPRDALLTAAFAVFSALFALFLSHETARAFERLARARD